MSEWENNNGRTYTVPEILEELARVARELGTSHPQREMEIDSITERDWARTHNLNALMSYARDGHLIRRRRRTITINGYEVPEPMREAPPLGARYCIARVDQETNEMPWDGDVYDRQQLARGICHATREAAEAHAEALLSFTSIAQ